MNASPLCLGVNMDKLTMIDLGGHKYPLLCDLNVLETIQNEFGSINEFELALLGVEYMRDADGKQMYLEDGTPRVMSKEPSIKAIKIALVEMINEGIAYQAYKEGKSWDMLEDLDIVSDCHIPFNELSTILHAEYKRCFETKKPMPRESKRKKTTS